MIGSMIVQDVFTVYEQTSIWLLTNVLLFNQARQTYVALLNFRFIMFNISVDIWQVVLFLFFFLSCERSGRRIAVWHIAYRLSTNVKIYMNSIDVLLTLWHEQADICRWIDFSAWQENEVMRLHRRFFFWGVHIDNRYIRTSSSITIDVVLLLHLIWSCARTRISKWLINDYVQ
jgi:hypothetical protein